MSEHYKQLSPSSEGQGQEDTDVLSILKKMQQHLVYLEKKIDMLVGQSSSGGGRPFNKDRHFSKPSRPFGHSRPPRSHDGPRGERNFNQARPFDKGPRSFEGGPRSFDKGPRKEHGGSGGGEFPRRKKQWPRRDR